MNQTLILMQSHKEERGTNFIFEIFVVTIGPFDESQVQTNDSNDNVLYAEVAGYQRNFTEMERLARVKQAVRNQQA